MSNMFENLLLGISLAAYAGVMYALRLNPVYASISSLIHVLVVWLFVPLIWVLARPGILLMHSGVFEDYLRWLVPLFGPTQLLSLILFTILTASTGVRIFAKWRRG